ncbi:MAG: hypothetical protein IT520_15220 [Burkholderiales bacterium]|nr:hypothetical protein [Burkholderiales bacterium]
MRVRALPCLVLAAFAFAGAPAAAQKTVGGNPGPANNYVCPNVDGAPGLDCYFDAVRHLYTMCRHVKSIEIIEWGHAQSQDGLNRAKSDSCVTKQRGNMTKPYQAALKEASLSRQAVQGVRSLQEAWLASLDDLSWRPGESADDYLTRTVTPYVDFEERIDGIQTIVDTVRARVKPLPSTQAAAKSAPKAAAAPSK